MIEPNYGNPIVNFKLVLVMKISTLCKMHYLLQLRSKNYEIIFKKMSIVKAFSIVLRSHPNFTKIISFDFVEVSLTNLFNI
jgi:hypothetical protein